MSKSFTPRTTFADLVEATEHAHRDAIVTGDADCVEEIKEHLDWILVNIDEGDSDSAKLENLAAAVAAAHRYGRQLVEKIGEERARKIQSELLA